jgi:hypothetical protein
MHQLPSDHCWTELLLYAGNHSPGHAETVDVLYDATRGFPVSIQIDGSRGIADDELFYGTRDFVVR